MTKEEKVVLLTNPNRVLEQLIKNFIKDNEQNRRTQLDQGVYWEEPLVGFASGLDPLFFAKEVLSQLPKEKTPCFTLATDALKLAIEECRCKQTGVHEKGGFDLKEIEKG